MASRLNPYLSFTDTARPAMEYYRSVFGGELVINTFGEYGAAGSPSADLVMHAQLVTPQGFTLMASDMPPDQVPEGETPGTGGNITVSLSGDAADADALRGYWERLSDGGTVTMPFERQMWGDEFGMCVDRFGISWMVDIGQE